MATDEEAENDRVQRVIEFTKKHWVRLLGLASVTLLLVLGWASDNYLRDPNVRVNTLACMLSMLNSDASPCEPKLSSAVNMAIPEKTASRWASDYMDEGSPLPDNTAGQNVLWVDNIAVDIYSIFFLGSVCAAYRRRTAVLSEQYLFWRLLFAVTTAFIVAGAIADHGENFWLLAKMAEGFPASEEELRTAALFTSAKFYLFFVNILLVAAWWLETFIRENESRRKTERVFTLLGKRNSSALCYKLGVSESSWPEVLKYGKQTSGFRYSLPVWQAALFTFFILDDYLPYNGKGMSFSVHAVFKFMPYLLKPNISDSERIECDVSVRAFFKELCRFGILSPNGDRYTLGHANLSTCDRVPVQLYPEDLAQPVLPMRSKLELFVRITSFLGRLQAALPRFLR